MQAAPPKAVFLLGADDYDEADVPADAFVVYQVRLLDKLCASTGPCYCQAPRNCLPAHSPNRTDCS